MLSVKGLSAGYGTIQAVRDVDLNAPQGSIVSIIGLNRQKSGEIIFNGQPIAGLPAHRIVGLGLSLVSEGRQIFSHLTVEDNIRLGAYLFYKNRRRREIGARIREMYELFPILARRAGQIAGSLSGGEQQMLAIARALMIKPKMLLLDEPSMGLAPLIVKSILGTIEQLHATGTTVLLVEQNARAALQISDFAYVLETGRLVLQGPARELLNDPKVKTAYLGG